MPALSMHTSTTPAAIGVSRKVHLSLLYLFLFYPLPSWKGNQLPSFPRSSSCQMNNSNIIHSSLSSSLLYRGKQLVQAQGSSSTENALPTRKHFCSSNETLKIYSVKNLTTFKVHGGAEEAVSRRCPSLSVILFLLCPMHTQDSNLPSPLPCPKGEIQMFAAAHSRSWGVFCNRHLAKPSLFLKILFQQNSTFTFSK